jgi:hypothetical protein
VAAGLAGLRIIDVTNPQSPIEIGYNDSLNYADRVVVSGNYAYVTDGLLRIIDVSNAHGPTEAAYCHLPGTSMDVAVSGNYAYVTVGGGLQIVDVSDPHHPTLNGFCSTPHNPPYGVAVSGNDVYVADADSGLRVIDVSDPQHPTEIGRYHDSLLLARGVVVSGGYAYVAGGRLEIVDISNPASPILAGYHDGPWNARSVALSGNYACVAEMAYGLYVFQFTGTGVHETPKDEVRTTDRPATIVRGELEIPPTNYRSPLTAYRFPLTAQLLDVSGRKALDLRPGTNDVSRLAPGVYFIQGRTTDDGRRTTTKIIIQH